MSIIHTQSPFLARVLLVICSIYPVTDNFKLKDRSMKILLVAFIIFATLPVFAESGTWYKIQSQACSSGEELKAFDEVPNLKVQISEDLKKLNKQVEDINGASLESYKMVKVGKNTYMAVPQELNHTDVFYVKVNEDKSEVSINNSDFMGASCGGGLIVTKMLKDSSAQEFIEVKTDVQMASAE